MSKVLESLRKRKYIGYIDDERDCDNGIIVTLKKGYFFNVDPGCGVRGFDTVVEVANECRKKDVYYSPTEWNSIYPEDKIKEN